MSDTHPPDILWTGDTPVSVAFDDPYFSREDGLAETRHVFLAGNDLPRRFARGFHIAELGVGSGLNLVAALMAWRASGADGPLTYTGFEAYPLPPESAARALAHFGEIEPKDTTLVTELLTRHWVATGELTARLIPGDARCTLPAWDGRADAWFLDGFAPVRNPEMWDPALLAQVARHTAPGGTAATYTAAGHVRRALGDAGFHVDRRPGYGRKRHMTAARLR